MKVSVSFLKSKVSKKECIERIEKTSASYIHVDLMDGVFVPEKNDDIEEVISLLKNHIKPLDIHLMVQDPKEDIKKLSILKPEYITIQVEIEQVKEDIKLIHSYGIKAGLAINPDTSIEKLKPFLNDIDLVLVMSVYPGKGGQSFIMDSIGTLQELQEINMNIKNDFKVSIDGGINKETVGYVCKYVDQVVSGSFVCMSDDYERQINMLS